jgi:hypothetical protein
MSDDKLEKFYEKAFKLASEVEPEMVAGVYMAQAMRFYKTFLSDEDYNDMIDTISESRDKIKPLEIPEQGTLH